MYLIWDNIKPVELGHWPSQGVKPPSTRELNKVSICIACSCMTGTGRRGHGSGSGIALGLREQLLTGKKRQGKEQRPQTSIVVPARTSILPLYLHAVSGRVMVDLIHPSFFTEQARPWPPSRWSR